MRNLTLSLLTAFIFAGCAGQTWTKPGLTQAEFLRDRYECERDSELVGAMPTGPYGGLVLATAQIGLIARKGEMKDMCMRAKGYVPGDEAPVDANTLQRPPASPPALPPRLEQAATPPPPSHSPSPVSFEGRVTPTTDCVGEAVKLSQGTAGLSRQRVFGAHYDACQAAKRALK